MRFSPILVLALCVTACQKAPPKDVAAMVNGRAITFSELDKQYEWQFGGGGSERTSEERKQIQKMELLRSLIDGEIMVQRAEKLGLMAVDADVETRFNEMKAPYTQEEFQKRLTEWKMMADDLWV